MRISLIFTENHIFLARFFPTSFTIETYSPGPVLRANYQSQSNNEKQFSKKKMSYACNCLKHQNNQKNIFTILRHASLDLDITMVKCNIKFKKIYIKNLWDRFQSNCYSGTDPLLQGTDPML